MCRVVWDTEHPFNIKYWCYRSTNINNKTRYKLRLCEIKHENPRPCILKPLSRFAIKYLITYKICIYFLAVSCLCSYQQLSVSSSTGL